METVRNQTNSRTENYTSQHTLKCTNYRFIFRNTSKVTESNQRPQINHKNPNGPKHIQIERNAYPLLPKAIYIEEKGKRFTTPPQYALAFPLSASIRFMNPKFETKSHDKQQRYNKQTMTTSLASLGYENLCTFFILSSMLLIPETYLQCIFFVPLLILYFH
ncbi:hypothetical protein AB6A40_008798 [Gnathostoma spinigerum]|uniref:Uncharacterized protein n=1 Tax=Gnathostoma spinigerum TaxID=75299 RepID=A0ABD6EV77_9BILA